MEIPLVVFFTIGKMFTIIWWHYNENNASSLCFYKSTIDKMIIIICWHCNENNASSLYFYKFNIGKMSTIICCHGDQNIASGYWFCTQQLLGQVKLSMKSKWIFH